jgi:hypothetical protein
MAVQSSKSRPVAGLGVAITPKRKQTLERAVAIGSHGMRERTMHAAVVELG